MTTHPHSAQMASCALAPARNTHQHPRLAGAQFREPTTAAEVRALAREVIKRRNERDFRARFHVITGLPASIIDTDPRYEYSRTACEQITKRFWMTPAERIIDEVANRNGLKAEQLMARRRLQALVRARHEAFYELYDKTKLSLPQIGRKFGMDHTTVLHGARKHAARNGLPLLSGH